MHSWDVHIITLFPECFPGPLGISVIGRALDQKLWNLSLVNMRDFSNNKHCKVDDAPFGGGFGMIIKAEVLASALESIPLYDKAKLIYMSPKGRPITAAFCKELINSPTVIICGRYEGIDQRFLEKFCIEEVSLGNFILSGGEIPAMAIIDAAVRFIPGALGKYESVQCETCENFLEYPQYTRPRIWRDIEVPAVLMSGNHMEIAKWREQKSTELTEERNIKMSILHVTEK